MIFFSHPFPSIINK